MLILAEALKVKLVTSCITHGVRNAAAHFSPIPVRILSALTALQCLAQRHGDGRVELTPASSFGRKLLGKLVEPNDSSTTRRAGR
jgi:hypothetical protein